MQYQVHTLAERPALAAEVDRLSAQSWPRFLMHGVRGWDLLFDLFAQYQIMVCNDAGSLIAVGHTVPLVWDGTIDHLPATIEDIIARALEATQGSQAPTAFCALAAMVDPGQRGNELSRRILLEMKALAGRYGASSLLAPVRPTWKSLYPLSAMDRYVGWRRPDGLLFDPWLRVHQRLGATGLSIAPNTLTITGRIKDWETWTDMAFPETGHYIVPGALQPVMIDCERDLGQYEDPNYWMAHPVITG